MRVSVERPLPMAATSSRLGLLLLLWLPTAAAQEKEPLEQIDIAMLAIGLAFGFGTALFLAEKIIGRCTPPQRLSPTVHAPLMVCRLTCAQPFARPCFECRFWLDGLSMRPD